MSKDGFTDEYYERAWSRIALSISPQEEQRIRETLSLIPEDVSSILDVGCGDGRITNHLIPQYSKVVGLESSREALRNVRAERVLGSIDSLPFPDKTFDLVLCCEVLEHLPFKVYPRAIQEIERVAAKYIIITVPNAQDLKSSLVTCPHCGCKFSPNRHLRSFTSKALEGLFSQFSLQAVQVCLLSGVYPAFLLKGARFLKLVPEAAFSPTALCPQCGYCRLLSEEASSPADIDTDSLRLRFLRPLAKRLIPARKQGGWLMALYQLR